MAYEGKHNFLVFNNKTYFKGYWKNGYIKLL